MTNKKLPGRHNQNGSAEALGVAHLQKIVACEDALEEALHVLVTALQNKAKKGKKPVVVHSLRVAFRLLGMGLPSEVVVAGVLHDILEKCAISPAQLIRRFGLDVGLIVQATTNNLHLRDPLERYADSVSRCAAYGEGALLVRAADLLDNCERTLSLGGMARLSRLAEKLRLLTAVCRDEDIDAAMIDELQRCLRRVNRRLAGLSLVDKPDSANKAARPLGRKES